MELSQKEVLKKKAATGAIVLGTKRIIVQVIYTVSNIFLARLLFPSDFGSFAIATFIVGFFTVFSDIGLGPSLVQKKEKLSPKDLQTAFTTHLILSLAIVLLIFLTAPLISKFYNLGQTGINLLRLYSVYLIFLPIKTVSGAILERGLEYKRLVAAEVLEIGAISAVTVVFAILGAGVMSFAAGAVFGRLIGAGLYFSLSPWPAKFAIYKNNLLTLAKFGLPFQSQAWLGLFFGPLVLLYLGKQVGTENLGFYQFAAGLSTLPLAVSEIVNRIVFPLGARTWKDKVFLKQIIETSLIIVSFVSLPTIAILLATAPQIIHFVYTDRWLPALPVLYLGLIQMGVISYTGIFAQLLLSLGRADIMRNISAVWAVLTWILAPPLILYFNFVGMSLAGLVVSASGIWLIFRLHREVRFSVTSNFYPFLASSSISGLVIFLLIHNLPINFLNLVISLILGGVVYITLVWILKAETILTNFKFLISALKS